MAHYEVCGTLEQSGLQILISPRRRRRPDGALYYQAQLHQRNSMSVKGRFADFPLFRISENIFAADVRLDRFRVRILMRHTKTKRPTFWANSLKFEDHILKQGCGDFWYEIIYPTWKDPFDRRKNGEYYSDGICGSWKPFPFNNSSDDVEPKPGQNDRQKQNRDRQNERQQEEARSQAKSQTSQGSKGLSFEERSQKNAIDALIKAFPKAGASRLRRALAMIAHPDAGGSNAVMAHVNTTLDNIAA